MIETLRREATNLDDNEAQDFAFAADILDNWNMIEEKDKDLWFRMERTVA